MKSFFRLLLLVLLLVACDSDEDLKNQEQVGIEAENENTQNLVAQKTVDLKNRQNFISAIEGEFEGTLTIASTDFKVRVVLIPTLPVVQTQGPKTLDELVFEINNSNVTAEILQWNPSTPSAYVGCVIEKIAPSIDYGKISFASEDCNNSYEVFISDGDKTEDYKSNALKLSKQIKSGEINFIQNINVKMKLKSSAVYQLNLERI